MSKENLRIAFDILDEGQNGYLDINQFKVTKNFGKPHCEDLDCTDQEHIDDNNKWIELLGDVEQQEGGKIDFE